MRKVFTCSASFAKAMVQVVLVGVVLAAILVLLFLPILHHPALLLPTKVDHLLLRLRLDVVPHHHGQHCQQFLLANVVVTIKVVHPNIVTVKMFL